MRALRMVPILILVLVVTTVAAQTQETDGDDVRLWLEGGGYLDVVGPLEHKNGLLLFHTLEGRLSSIAESKVTGTTDVPSADSKAPAAPAPRLPVNVQGSGSYSNTDLPKPAEPLDVNVNNDAPPDSYSNVDLPELVQAPAEGETGYTNANLPEAAAPDGDTADEPSVPGRYTNASLPEPAEPLADNSDTETEAAPVPGQYTNADLPESPVLPPAAEDTDGSGGGVGLGLAAAEYIVAIHNIDEEIEVELQQENLAYRLWACATNDIPLVGPECNPTVRPKSPVRTPLSPMEKSLARKMKAAHDRIEALHERRKALVSEAEAEGIDIASVVGPAPSGPRALEINVAGPEGQDP